MTRNIVLFTILRLGIFAAAFGLLLLGGFDWAWAVVLAAVASLCVSYLALKPLRDRISTNIWERQQKPPPDVDANVEDEIVDKRRTK